ncbi:MAG: hypothetical protein F6K39_46200 [Okeania sp. SIO3B3]|nr:hypothetical protein [Okeania sp. SIO3B3]
MISYKNFFTSNFALFLQLPLPSAPAAFPLPKYKYLTEHDIRGGLSPTPTKRLVKRKPYLD